MLKAAASGLCEEGNGNKKKNRLTISLLESGIDAKDKWGGENGGVNQRERERFLLEQRLEYIIFFFFLLY